VLWALLTIFISLLLIVPYAYWVKPAHAPLETSGEFFTLKPISWCRLFLACLAAVCASVAFMVELPVLLIAG